MSANYRYDTRLVWLSRLAIFVTLLVVVGKAKIVLVSVVSVIAILLVVFFVTGLFSRDNAGILINTTPTAAVYIDDVEVGRTPHEEKMKAGEVTVRLVPESFDEPLAPFETKVNLASGIQTIIDREFAATPDNSSGVIVSFEKVGGKEVSVSIVSTPDAAQVIIDGQVKGFTPFKTSTITAGKHTIAVSSPGYNEKSLDIQTQQGYKLTAIFNLAKDGEEVIEEELVEPQAEEEIVEDETVTVVILETPTGYLRVRKEPSTLAEEIGRVKPDEEYKLLDEDEKTGWYKIQLDEGDEGWISNQYATKSGDGGTSSSPKPTPTATPKATN